MHFTRSVEVLTTLLRVSACALAKTWGTPQRRGISCYGGIYSGSSDVFDQDEDNPRHIAERHAFTRSQAEEPFADPARLTTAIGIVAGEARFLLIGTAPNGAGRAIVFTWRDRLIRVVSARPASRKERQAYRLWTQTP